MEYEKFEGPDGVEIRVPGDEDYRTCSLCGGDCEPESSGADGLGIRIMWSVPITA